ncbi:MAG: peptide chain release factor-like protein, partial [Burkholderiaceae bacterium]
EADLMTSLSSQQFYDVEDKAEKFNELLDFQEKIARSPDVQKLANMPLYREDDSIEIEINPADVRTDTYRASGAGGQHVNKTDSAVRLTHVPTGIVVQCQNDRSQHRNRDEAWKMLKSRLYEHEMRKRMAEQQKLEDSKTDVGWGHQIRSYVLDQSRIKDLRTSVEISNTQKVLDGDLDAFIEASLKQGV